MDGGDRKRSLLVRVMSRTLGVPLRFLVALVPEEGRLVLGVAEIFRPPCSFTETTQEG
jgi:hypothetical protein